MHMLYVASVIIVSNIGFAALLMVRRRNDIPRRARLMRWVIHPYPRMHLAKSGIHRGSYSAR